MYTGEFIIDKITNSIEETKTGIINETDVLLATEKECRSLFKKDGWYFNWKTEFKTHGRNVYKLVRRNGDGKVEGMISCSAVPDQRYFIMHLIEVAPHNFGAGKRYVGVPGNLVAFICKMSFEMGFGGVACFDAKTALIQHYIETLGASHEGGQKMVIYSEEARFLVNSYFKNHRDEK